MISEIASSGEIVLAHTSMSSALALILSVTASPEPHYQVVYLEPHVDSHLKNDYSVVLGSDDLDHGSLESERVVQLDRTTFLTQKDIQQRSVAHVKVAVQEKILKSWAYLVTKSYYQTIHKPRHEQTFEPGKSRIGYAGRVFDEKEMLNLIDSSLDFWLTSGPYTDRFERGLAEKLGVRYCALVNSGSSANLIAFMALTSSKLGERQIRKGDEVITVAAGFPTTVNPIIQYGAIPVFIDVTLPTYNVDITLLEEALSPKTKAVMLAHTLGNPYDLAAVTAFCKKHHLWLVEDNCDALGSLYQGQYTGSFGDIGTSSFYPPHHLTMGEGGAVYTRNSRLKVIIESFRDWGRDCYCASGKDNTCKKRFDWELGTLPKGYDHKYIYSHFGYNLKATDMQAAIGCAQLEKLEAFTQARRRNWEMMREGVQGLEDWLILPEATADSQPSWFGFMLTVRDNSKLKRSDIVEFLEGNQIQTRALFSGNYLRHPAFDEMRKTQTGYRVVGSLKNTDRIMNDSFWLGVYPGMKPEMTQYMIDSLKKMILG